MAQEQMLWHGMHLVGGSALVGAIRRICLGGPSANCDRAKRLAVWLCRKTMYHMFCSVSDNHFTANCNVTKLIRIRSVHARCGMQYH